MKIVTDSTPLEAPKDPTDSYIVQLYRLFATATKSRRWRPPSARADRAMSLQAAALREIRDHFAPMRERREANVKDAGYVERRPRDGREERQRPRARKVIDRVRGRSRHVVRVPWSVVGDR